MISKIRDFITSLLGETADTGAIFLCKQVTERITHDAAFWPFAFFLDIAKKNLQIAETMAEVGHLTTFGKRKEFWNLMEADIYIIADVYNSRGDALLNFKIQAIFKKHNINIKNPSN